MAKTKKTKKTNYEKVYKQFHYEMDTVLFNLFELKDDAFNGNLTHKEMVERLFEVCAQMNNSMETAEASAYEDN